MRLKDVFIQNLRKYRRNSGISQMTLAERCGTSTSYIGQIEIGNRFPSLEMIEKISEALQIQPYLLFCPETDEKLPEKMLPVKTRGLSSDAKNQLIKRLTAAISRVVKRTDI